MSLTVMMGDGQMSDEERELLAKQLVKNEANLREDLAREKEKDEAKKAVTLEELFKTIIDPTDDRVLIFPDPVETITEGGIIKPKEVVDKERQLIGTVIAVGPGKKNEALFTNKILIELLRFQDGTLASNLEKEMNKNVHQLKPGQRVMYGRMAGTPIEDPATKTELLIMRPNDIFGKV